MLVNRDGMFARVIRSEFYSLRPLTKRCAFQSHIFLIYHRVHRTIDLSKIRSRWDVDSSEQINTQINRWVSSVTIRQHRGVTDRNGLLDSFATLIGLAYRSGGTCTLSQKYRTHSSARNIANNGGSGSTVFSARIENLWSAIFLRCALRCEKISPAIWSRGGREVRCEKPHTWAVKGRVRIDEMNGSVNHFRPQKVEDRLFRNSRRGRFTYDHRRNWSPCRPEILIERERKYILRGTLFGTPLEFITLACNCN